MSEKPDPRDPAAKINGAPFETEAADAAELLDQRSAAGEAAQLAELKRRYLELGHAIQSAIAYNLSQGETDACNGKHLRVGLDLRACDHAALVRLLIEKGVFTDLEYNDALVAELEREVGEHQDRITAAIRAVNPDAPPVRLK